MSSVIAAGGLGKERPEDIDQGGRHARHLAARGRVLQTAHGGLGTEIAAAKPAARFHGQFEEGIAAQGVAVVGILISAGDREHAEAKHRRQRRGPLRSRVDQPLPDTTRQRLGQAEPAFGIRATGPARRRTRSARPRNRRSPSCGLQAGRSNGMRSIFGHGGRGALVVSGEMRLATNFYRDLNGLRHVRHHIVAPQGIKRASGPLNKPRNSPPDRTVNPLR